MTRTSQATGARFEEFALQQHHELDAALLDAARTLPGFSLYHDRPWAELLRDAFGWRVRAISAWHGDHLVAFLPYVRKRRFGRAVHICLPLGHDPGLLMTDAHQDTVSRILSAIGPLELHAPLPGTEPPDTAAAAQLEVYIDLAAHQTPETILAGMSKNHRQVIRRSYREDIRIEVADTPDAYAIYADLQAATRQRQGSPNYPSAFFPALAKRLGGPGLAELRLAYYQRKAVAGMITLSDAPRNRIIYAYAASADDRDALAAGVNPRLMWESLQAAHAGGAREFSFSSTAAGHHGLLRYKQRFGGQTRTLARFCYPAGAARKPQEGGLLNRLGTPVLKRMPAPLFRNLSPYLLAEVL